MPYFCRKKRILLEQMIQNMLTYKTYIKITYNYNLSECYFNSIYLTMKLQYINVI